MAVASCSPTVTEVRSNPNWPAFRDELDADVQKAADARDYQAWKRACRRRVAYGNPVDVPGEFTVDAEFYKTLERHLRDVSDRLGHDLGGSVGEIMICRIPILAWSN